MKELEKLTYLLEIEYEDAGSTINLSLKFNDEGLKEKSVKVGNESVIEQYTNGRVLSGRFDRGNEHGGWEYDYQKGEVVYALEDSNMSVEDSENEIEKIKKKFHSSDFVLYPILRNDYKNIALDEGSINVTRTLSAQNEKSEQCVLQEQIKLFKPEDDDCVKEESKKRIYKLNDREIEESQTLVDGVVKSQLMKLSEIMSQYPHNYHKLIELKNSILSDVNNNKIDEGNSYE